MGGECLDSEQVLVPYINNGSDPLMSTRRLMRAIPALAPHFIVK